LIPVIDVSRQEPRHRAVGYYKNPESAGNFHPANYPWSRGEPQNSKFTSSGVRPREKIIIS
jgi:hypothetical protein